jgi:uncharacterized protein DUF6069
MTTTTDRMSAPSTSRTSTRTRVPFLALARASASAAGAAAVTTESLTAVVRAAGVRLAVGDPGGSSDSVVPVGLGACTVSILLCMVIGTAFAALLNRRSPNPARSYRRVAVALVALSFVAPLTAAATSPATKLTLCAAHLIAAAIVVPVVSRRLAAAR